MKISKEDIERVVVPVIYKSAGLSEKCVLDCTKDQASKLDVLAEQIAYLATEIIETNQSLGAKIIPIAPYLK